MIVGLLVENGKFSLMNYSTATFSGPIKVQA